MVKLVSCSSIAGKAVGSSVDFIGIFVGCFVEIFFGLFFELFFEYFSGLVHGGVMKGSKVVVVSVPVMKVGPVVGALVVAS